MIIVFNLILFCYEAVSNVVCSALLVSLPVSTTASLQRVQNDAARLILLIDGLILHIHSKKLHWLPIHTHLFDNKRPTGL